MSQQNIAFANSPTVTLSVTTTSARVALAQKSPFILVSNTGSNPAWVSSGDANIAATASTGNGVCVPNGQTMFLRISPNDTNVAAVCATGTATLSISNANGGITS